MLLLISQKLKIKKQSQYSTLSSPINVHISVLTSGYPKVEKLGNHVTCDRQSHNRRDLIEAFKICKGFSRIRPKELVLFDNMGKATRGHSLKLVKVMCTWEGSCKMWGAECVELVKAKMRGVRCGEYVQDVVEIAGCRVCH